MEPVNIYRLNRERPIISSAAPLLNPSTSPQKPKLLDQVRGAIRTRHYSDKTEKAYIHWIKRFIFFHDKRHPLEMVEPEIARFLSNLAIEGRVSASTQNQAFNALLFLYAAVLNKKIGHIEGVVRAKTPQRLPVVPMSSRLSGSSRCSRNTTSWPPTILICAGMAASKMAI